MSSGTALAEVGCDQPVGRDGVERRLKGRSQATNNVDQLPNTRLTSSAARRFRDLMGAFLVDMGGVEQCSEIKLNLLRRLASVIVQSERIEARMINGGEVDIGLLCQLASTSVRLAQRVGIERVPRDVST